MTLKEQECIEHLQNGINLKRRGKPQEALSEYEKAFYKHPFNLNIYKNIAKIYMSAGHSVFAMRNILTYAHLTLRENPVNMESYDFAINFYQWSGKLNENFSVIENLAVKAVSTDINLAKIISDLNLTFWAGFCFLIKHKDIITNFKIPGALLNNYVKSILGQPVEGKSLTDSNAASMIRIVGFSYIIRNIITNPDLDKWDIIDIYLKDDFNVEDF